MGGMAAVVANASASAVTDSDGACRGNCRDGKRQSPPAQEDVEDVKDEDIMSLF